MTRIIAGTARGRRLAVPKSGTRPTADRVRESWFATLESTLMREGRSWASLRVLDLFAGSGALGLEAASRGAAEVVMVERARAAVQVLRSNSATLDLPGVTVVAAEAGAWARGAARVLGPFDLVLVDPPYDLASSEIASLLEALPLAAEAIVVVERAAGGSEARRSPLPEQWESEQRRYGDTVLWYGRAASGPSPERGEG